MNITDRLFKLIARAEARFIDKAPELNLLGRRFAPNRFGLQAREITAESVAEWLRGVTHQPHSQHRRTNVHAYASYKRQLIVYNPMYLQSVDSLTWEDRIFDLVLHELGHLFTYWFYGRVGHDDSWRAVGRTVGYVPIGSTREKKRYTLMRAYSQVSAEPEVVLFGLDELKELPLGITIPMGTEMEIEGASVMKKDELASAIFAAQGMYPQAVETVRAKLIAQRKKHAKPEAEGTTKKPRERSKVYGAVAQVWKIADSMKGAQRKDVINECVAQGINVNTAKTQYGKWKRERGAA